MKTLKESLLSDIDTTIQNGNNEITKVTSIFGNYELVTIFGGNNKSEHEYTEQFFNDNVNKFDKELFFNDKLQLYFGKKRKYRKHINFGKWLEHICLGDIRSIKEPFGKEIYTAELEKMNIGKKIINLAIKNKLIDANNKVKIDVFSTGLLDSRYIYVNVYMNNDKSHYVLYAFRTK